MRLLVAIPKTADFSILVIKQAKLGMPSCSVIGRLIDSHASPVVTTRIKVGNALPFGIARTGKYCSSWILVGTWEPEMVSKPPLLRKFAFVTPSAQAEGLPDCSRWLSAAIPPDRHRKCATTPEGSQKFWHPFRMHGSPDCLPGVSAPLRPLATLCQPSGLD